MRVILYVLMVAAAALNTYHPKKQAAAIQEAKHATANKANSNAIAFNNNAASFTSAQSN